MVSRVTVTLPEDLLARLDSVAADERVSRSDVVREAAAEYLSRRKSDRISRLRQTAAEEGVAWLEGIASREQSDSRSSLEILHELRESRPLGESLQSTDDGESP